LEQDVEPGTWSSACPLTHQTEWRVNGILVSSNSTYTPTLADRNEDLIATDKV